METKKLLRFSSLALIFGLAFVASCTKEERLSPGDSNAIKEETETDTYYQDVDDMGNVAISAPTDTQYNGGRVSGTITITGDSRFCSSAVVTLTSTGTSTSPQGTITVDFGTSGCTDAKGNVRKGKLILTYNGRRFMPGSTVVTTPENYSINGVKLEGTRTVTNVTANTSSYPRFNTVLSNGKATFEDGTVALRNSNITTEWVRANNPLEDQLKIETGSEASGTTRAGREYTMDILETLVYKRACGMAVDGVKTFVINGTKTINIDYGDGTCDRSITVTVDGATHNISMGN